MHAGLAAYIFCLYVCIRVLPRPFGAGNIVTVGSRNEFTRNPNSEHKLTHNPKIRPLWYLVWSINYVMAFPIEPALEFRAPVPMWGDRPR